jgi:hypothetical protein
MRAVALVADLLELGVVLAAGAALDGALDVVGGHVDLTGLLHGQAQPEVADGVGTALARRHRQLAGHLGEDLAALGVDDRLLVLDPRPLAVTGHEPSVAEQAFAIVFRGRRTVYEGGWLGGAPALGVPMTQIACAP